MQNNKETTLPLTGPYEGLLDVFAVQVDQADAA